MVCDKCKEREARVFLTQIVGETATKSQLCAECAQEFGLPDGLTTVDLAHLDKRARSFEAFLQAATRHPREAYEFLCEALAISRQFGEYRSEKEQKSRHVTGQELLGFIRDLAVAKFGKQARAVLAGWKLYRTEDFGEMVFEMVDAGLVSKTKEDSIEDFKNVFDFEEAFPEN